MTPKIFTLAAFVFGWALGGATALVAGTMLQERPAHTTRSWTIETGIKGPDLYVTETTGTCIYATFHGIAVISRAQLPVGAGCE